MKILIAMLHPGYLRYYFEATRELARRGHSIVFTFDVPHKQTREGLRERLLEEFPSVSTVPAPTRQDRWEGLARAVSWGMDYLRYLTPEFADARRLRLRLEVIVHPTFQRLMRDKPPWFVKLVSKLLRRVYDLIPVSREFVDFIRRQDPDLVLVTPLITQGAAFQAEYLRAAKVLGIPTAYCVASWDNLSSKGLIRGNPDRVVLWNDVQKREAVRWHGIEPPSVVTTGAQNFDPWFSRQPSTSREEFCDRVGLRPDRPFLVYLCSSNFMAPNEPRFTLRWIEGLRSSPSPVISELGVLIRPYPEHFLPWQDVDPGQYDNVTIWPEDGAYPLTEETRAEFFDAIHHSVGVVGVNTSALIETAIIGRPAWTIRAAEFRSSQEGTIHFQYLLRGNGGFAEVASTIEEHLQQLQRSLESPGETRKAVDDFVKRFVRPHGIDRPATPFFIRAVEEAGRQPRSAPGSASLGTRLARRALAPVAHEITRYRRGPKWREHAEQWKRASRRAEKRGADPLEVWQEMQQGSEGSAPRESLPGMVGGYLARRSRKTWRRLKKRWG